MWSARRLWHNVYGFTVDVGSRCVQAGGTIGIAVLAPGLRVETLRQMASHLRTGRAVGSIIYQIGVRTRIQIGVRARARLRVPVIFYGFRLC